MKQIEVQIMGQSYLLASSDDGEAILRKAVAKVDTAMCQIRDAGKIKARDRIAVLAALNIAAQSLEMPATPAASAPLTTHTSESAQYDLLLAKLDSALL